MDTIHSLVTELVNTKVKLNDIKNKMSALEQEKYASERHKATLIQKIRAKRRNAYHGLVPVDINSHDENTYKRIWEKKGKVLSNFKHLEFDKMHYSTHGANAGYPEDNFSVRWSMSFEKLPKVVAEGKVRFIASSWDGDEYTSPILKSPTYFKAFQYFHKSIYTTQDHHHIYLEDVTLETEKDGIKYYRFVTGS